MDSESPVLPDPGDAPKPHASSEPAEAPAGSVQKPVGDVPEVPTGDAVLPDNVAAMLSYFVVPAVAWLVLEPYKDKPTLRFHAWQALFLWMTCLMFYGAFSVVTGISSFFLDIMLLVLRIVNLAATITAIVCMVKAYNKEEYSLPILGALARQQSRR